MKYLLLLMACFCIATTFAQNTFIDAQRSNSKVANALKSKEDTLKKQFEKANLQWPAKHVYIRSFKYDSQLEVWISNNSKEPYKLFKTYKVCALSGAMGPKRIEGDYQVPEGFYCVNEFKPTSSYHLALGVNYPNASDLLLSDSLKPGGDIYIHGSCITVGCIPIQNEPIEELYVITAMAKNIGEDFIPVHIFPARFNVAKSADYLAKASKDDKDYQLFIKQLKEVYDYFELHKKLPLIAVNKKGEYVAL
ncbi:murein L,D-transpeptidase family protein [Parasediminibacterium paludis]|uniref:Murein L,D-transpeptidase family protein n=1 Tax=Parasediminibacterium paludis TaxID=908966 RepID=A0ABV8Q098_9BACT